MRKQPTHLKLLRGNPGKRRIDPEPQPAIAQMAPDAPAYLTGYAMDEWYRVADELHGLKLLSVLDVHALAAYCSAYSMWRTAVETMHMLADRDPVMHGLIIKTSAGAAMQNPLILTARQAARDMVNYASEFGMTPIARSRLASPDFVGSGKFGDLLQ